MKHTELSPQDQEIIFAKSLLWIGLALLGFLSALGGFFYSWIFIAYVLIASFFVTRYALKRNVFATLSRELWIIWLIGIILAVCAVSLSFKTSPTVFSGRDQGTLSEAAIRLSQNHTLEFSNPASDAFFKMYGPGKALNFPGFYYTAAGKLIPQFPLVYIAWLAIFYSFFGLVGFAIANAFLLLLFLFSFYALTRNFVAQKYSLWALAFVLTSFSFGWFFKFTLSENMTLALLWTMIFALTSFIEKQRLLSYAAFLASGILLIFTRIEGIAFFGVALIVLFSHAHTRQYFAKNYKKTLLAPCVFLFFLFLLNLTKNIYFYKELAKALLGTWNARVESMDSSSTNNGLPVFFTAQLFYAYGMLGFLLLGFFGAASAFIKKHFKILTVLYVILPSLIYLVDSHISTDHPWMLRRYVFSILPAGIFYTTVLLALWEEKFEKYGEKMKNILPVCAAVILISLSLPSFFKYIAFSENATLLDQTRQLANNFSSRDLVLVDRLASGSGWSMPTGPMSFLYGKNAVYFFNTNDLQKIDANQFDHIYLIVPDAHRMFYAASIIGEKLTPYREYSLTTTDLNITPQKNALLVTLPDQETTITHGMIYLIKKP